MAFILTDSQKVDLALKAKTKAGNPTTLENVVWATSDDTVATVESTGDLTAVVKTTGKLGTAQISIKADAKLGEGEKELTGTFDLEVVPGDAATIEVSAGEAAENE